MLLGDAIKKIVGTQSDREIKKLLPLVQRINALDPEMRKLSDAALQAKTAEFKERIAKGESLDSLLVEAFAVCREAGARVLGMRHFDVQLIGGMCLHKGYIAEMKTGEGKTLVATLASYLNALSGKGVHVITVNDYLAQRDSEWMGRIHRFLGLQVGCILNSMDSAERKIQYSADITYGTNNEFGFDYLRDNMKPSLEYYVQRDLNFAIVDEVDSILIDEARTPLIISGPSEGSTDLYYVADRAVKLLKKDVDFTHDEKSKNVTLTEDGVRRVEQLLQVENLYGPENLELVHHVHSSLRGYATMRRDIDYVVRDGEVIIVDEFTGRLMPGRRWSDGLHQAVEAKEGVPIQSENQTLATITLQNYFRMYNKLSGMTGTAETEAAEFKKIYGLGVMVIPTNRPVSRKDPHDLVYRNEAGKFRAVVQDIKEKYDAGRPVLVGTVSIAKSERISKLLQRLSIPHNVLNAKQHEREAEIIANAGQGRSVTIATNMAGRGTDIVLGSGVVETGGLHVIGTERHESRRIDNQLRGRSGRQGDPGSSQFYLSLEDDLMRIFASDRVIAIMDRLGMEEDVPISDRLVSKSIESAQKKVEMHHFDQREHLLKYDDVLNKQREVIYSMRRLVLEGKNTKELVSDLSREFAWDVVSQFADAKIDVTDWDWKALSEAVQSSFALRIDDTQVKELQKQLGSKTSVDDLVKWIGERASEVYARKEAEYGAETMRELEQHFFIQSLDHHWKEHLLALDHLKEGIHLRGYAQKDPLVEYRKEGFALFKLLDKAIRQTALSRLYTVRILSPEEQAQQRRQMEERQREIENLQMQGPSLDAETPGTIDAGAGASAPSPAAEAAPAAPPAGVSAALSFMRKYQQQRMDDLSKTREGGELPKEEAVTKPVVSGPKVGRNDPCFCGSGKKYKHCHGK
ncbi:MAG TPA: preprotein translocase subunit SecA [Bdellovibrionota bacterium]|jgi:preprotein translocase subunit SecA|nr:preprotein translocase subunit SecA [Bdellovibrionota bacterium]